jgi:hypothetical protein
MYSQEIITTNNKEETTLTSNKFNPSKNHINSSFIQKAELRYSNYFASNITFK